MTAATEIVKNYRMQTVFGNPTRKRGILLASPTRVTAATEIVKNYHMQTVFGNPTRKRGILLRVPRLRVGLSSIVCDAVSIRVGAIHISSGQGRAGNMIRF